MKKILLKGLGASAGVATGEVRLILDPSDSQKMAKGDILVCSLTNPLLTPAILKASAIVTDAGGFLSHAAIVARELGIPAVVETREATQILRDGMQVSVDGKRGVVYGS